MDIVNAIKPLFRRKQQMDLLARPSFLKVQTFNVSLGYADYSD